MEVADNVPGLIGVRDSKIPSGPVLVFGSAEWSVFVGGVKDGALDG
ncbi:hypothetical protein BJ992_003885 [Sphaerisporangium rubeum]|uniref:DUF397 domain-containing protein n=1 Tax=Sphaerisporangium rubeum TaxID=321317 RepID=A0A7X0M8X2_9ACTN|nr:hypothetical protein [Sphaerisporangium rubeum]